MIEKYPEFLGSLKESDTQKNRFPYFVKEIRELIAEKYGVDLLDLADKIRYAGLYVDDFYDKVKIDYPFELREKINQWFSYLSEEKQDEVVESFFDDVYLGEGVNKDISKNSNKFIQWVGKKYDQDIYAFYNANIGNKHSRYELLNMLKDNYISFYEGYPSWDVKLRSLDVRSESFKKENGFDSKYDELWNEVLEKPDFQEFINEKTYVTIMKGYEEEGFAFLGRSGGHMCLTNFNGYPVQFSNNDEYFDFLRNLENDDLIEFKKLIDKTDEDVENRHQIIENVYAEERKEAESLWEKGLDYFDVEPEESIKPE